ncbi:MAG: hypothetical protein O3B42_08050 [Actinomycetota bacterium]|nr:hypothetical protein [Actinomycetota bacterium]
MIPYPSTKNPNSGSGIVVVVVVDVDVVVGLDVVVVELEVVVELDVVVDDVVAKAASVVVWRQALLRSVRCIQQRSTASQRPQWRR